MGKWFFSDSLCPSPITYEFLQFLEWILSMNLAHFWNPLYRLANYGRLGGWGWQVVYLKAMAPCHCQGHPWTFRRMTVVMKILAMPAFCSQKSIVVCHHRHGGHCDGGTIGGLGVRETSCWSSCSVAHYRSKLLSFSFPEPKVCGCPLPGLLCQCLGQRCPKKYVSRVCI